jgi:ATP-dependent protease Clp ATPase subunit
MTDVDTLDLINFGLIPEFIGRFPIIKATTELSISELRNILLYPKNAILKQYKFLFALHGIELHLTDDAIDEIAKIAYLKRLKIKGKKYFWLFKFRCGARGLRSIVEGILTTALYYLPEINKSSNNSTKQIDPEIELSKMNEEDDNKYHTAIITVEVVSNGKGIVFLRSDMTTEKYLEKLASDTNLDDNTDSRVFIVCWFFLHSNAM